MEPQKPKESPLVLSWLTTLSAETEVDQAVNLRDVIENPDSTNAAKLETVKHDAANADVLAAATWNKESSEDVILAALRKRRPVTNVLVANAYVVLGAIQNPKSSDATKLEAVNHDAADADVMAEATRCDNEDVILAALRKRNPSTKLPIADNRAALGAIRNPKSTDTVKLEAVEHDAADADVMAEAIRCDSENIILAALRKRDPRTNVSVANTHTVLRAIRNLKSTRLSKIAG